MHAMLLVPQHLLSPGLLLTKHLQVHSLLLLLLLLLHVVKVLEHVRVHGHPSWREAWARRSMALGDANIRSWGMPCTWE